MQPRTLVWTDDTREAIVAEAIGILARGGLVAMPTETVYGLAARADSAEACARIYQAKRRPLSHPLIVHVAGVEAARALVLEHAHEVLAVWGNRFWPGPLTLVLPRSPRVLDAVTGGGPNVALRCSAHPVMAAVLANMPFGLAAPSANRYQGVSPTTAAHVAQSLGMACDLIIDGGPCSIGVESTIVLPSASIGAPIGAAHGASRVLRLGGISVETLRAFDPAIVVDAGTDADDEVHAAPGRDRRHYAPRCDLAFVSHASGLPSPSTDIGYLTYDEALRPGYCLWKCLANDAEGYGRGLYAALHEAESLGLQTLYVRVVPPGEAWATVRDRLARAGSH